MKVLYIVIFLLLIPLIWFFTIPVWSDSKKVCEYWEKQNGEMVCIKETTLFCLKIECED